MFSYILAFVFTFWPTNSHHRWVEVQSIVQDIATTDAEPLEALTLANVAAFESGFDTHAVGRQGERGAFQVMPPAKSYGASEALHRLRTQGLEGYCGCGSKGCPDLAEHRREKARLYAWVFPFRP